MPHPGMSVASTETALSSPPPAAEAGSTSRRRERWFLVVLLGLIVLIVGFTGTLLGQAAYPCVPPAGSGVEPPLPECAVALSPWVLVAIVGLLLAFAGYLRVH